MSQSPFLTSICDYMQVRHYSKRTISTYLYWVKQYILFHGKQHPRELAGLHVEQFLTFLAVKRNVSPSTQSLALNALVFVCAKILDRPLGDVSQFRRSRRQQKLPVVLTLSEVQRVLNALDGTNRLKRSKPFLRYRDHPVTFPPG